MSKVSEIIGKWGGDSARAFNRAGVLRLVQQSPGIDRTRLAESTGLTNAAMTGIVQELVDAGLLKIVEASQATAGRGRKRTGLAVDERGGYVLGISVLAINSRVALTDLVGNTIDAVAIEPSNIGDAQKTLDEVAEGAQRLLAKHAVDPNRVFGAGVAVAGYFDESGDVLESSPYLGWPAFDVRHSLANRLKMNVVVDNVNRCIAVAESRIGRRAGVQDMILIRAALGLGGAIVNDGDILRGAGNQAGQIGHMPAGEGDALCSCGNTGCLNTVASGGAILRELGLGVESALNQANLASREEKLKHVLDKAASGRIDYQNALRNAGAALGRHCASMIHVLAPKNVVLTGPLGRNRIYSEAFSTALAERHIRATLVTADQEEITAPAPAASALALSSHVYSPQLTIQHLLASAEDDAGDEVLVL